ncbi:hypothetical protein PHAVU_007G278000 [Phaseolus vulgaris]|uniref:Uncharacterized protein n=1 Tax=Phaseolus vulgaris TaxID=3885 RepID=V7BIW0_PHAVU|nr:hypothetical protein PHAVU_007G278000g [Phaseolus vulgaris]ESW17904.1 hypothetical protein PHAVU_007G278000g [Phaseolus vulgaris]
MTVMSKKVILRPAVSRRRQPLLQQSHSYPQAGTRLGEAVGGTAAVCCCFSFGLANMVYLAVYKVPASLFQKALRRKRRRLQSMGEGLEMAAHVRRCTCGCCDDIMGLGRLYPLCSDDEGDVAAVMRRRSVAEKDADVVELENEMWERFYGSGFWRSPSQRNEKAVPSPNLKLIAFK